MGCSQTKYIPIVGHVNMNTTNNLIKQEKLKGNYKLLVYLPASENTKKINTVLVIKKVDIIKYWLIKNETIVGKGFLNNDKIFSYDNFLKTGAVKKENTLKFVPPLMNGEKTEGVIYEDNNVRFYYQFGENVTGYSPDTDLNKFRGDWLTILRQELKGLL